MTAIVEEERAIPRPPPWDDIEIKALACADSLADGEKAVVQDVIDFLRWCHGDLERNHPSTRVCLGRSCGQSTRASGGNPVHRRTLRYAYLVDELAKASPEIPRTFG